MDRPRSRLDILDVKVRQHLHHGFVPSKVNDIMGTGVVAVKCQLDGVCAGCVWSAKALAHGH